MGDRLLLILGLALIGFWIVGAYNRLVRLRGAVASQWTAVDAALRRRHTLAQEGIGLAVASLPGGSAARWPAEDATLLAGLAAAARQAGAAAEAVARQPLLAGGLTALGLAEQVLDRVLADLRPRIEALQAAPGPATPPIPADPALGASTVGAAPGGPLPPAGTPAGPGTDPGDPVPAELPPGPRAILLQALAQALHQAGSQIAYARGPHDAAVGAYHAALREWPTCLVAGIFGFQPAAALTAGVGGEAAQPPRPWTDSLSPEPAAEAAGPGLPAPPPDAR